ncbi:MAG: hypothetical protein JNK12_03425 [Acidimicrobiales bacterium]|nr:hypothetical protein [Acidimicrobiales bacterium]
MSIVEAWLGEARRRVGVSRDDWLHPAVEALAEALDGGFTEPGPALARLGAIRASNGFTLDEVIEDLHCLYDVVDPARRVRLDRLDTLEVARGWVHGFAEATRDMGCVEPLTGCATEAFLRARLTQTYQHCDSIGLGAADVHSLVVVRLPLESLREPHRSLLAVRVAERLRVVFDGGETIASVGPGTFIVLVADTPAVGAALASLTERVEPDLVCDEASPVRTQLWIEGLPESLDQALSLIDDLTTRSRRRPTPPTPDP